MVLSSFRPGGEADFSKDFRDSFFPFTLNLWVFHAILEYGDVGVFALVVLHDAGFKHLFGWEAFKLTLSDRSHKSRLASPIPAAKPVSVALEQPQIGMN